MVEFNLNRFEVLKCTFNEQGIPQQAYIGTITKGSNYSYCLQVVFPYDIPNDVNVGLSAIRPDEEKTNYVVKMRRLDNKNFIVELTNWYSKLVGVLTCSLVMFRGNGQIIENVPQLTFRTFYINVEETIMSTRQDSGEELLPDFQNVVATDVKTYPENQTFEGELYVLENGTPSYLTLAKVKEYIKEEDSKTLEQAKTYTNDQVANLKKYVDESDTKTLGEAKKYSDSQDEAVKTELKNYADSQDNLKLQEAKSYADSQDNIKLQEAKDYSDSKNDELKQNLENQINNLKENTYLQKGKLDPNNPTANENWSKAQKPGFYYIITTNGTLLGEKLYKGDMIVMTTELPSSPTSNEDFAVIPNAYLVYKGKEDLEGISIKIDGDYNISAVLNKLPQNIANQYYTKTDTDNLLNPIKNDVNGLKTSKQDTLQSGINIKTINGNSILGEGDLPFSGGGGTDVVGNPSEDATVELVKIKIGKVVYSIPEADLSKYVTTEVLNQELAKKQDVIDESHVTFTSVTYADGVATFVGTLKALTESGETDIPFNFDLPMVAGENVTIDADESGQKIVVSASGGTNVEANNGKHTTETLKTLQVKDINYNLPQVQMTLNEQEPSGATEIKGMTITNPDGTQDKFKFPSGSGDTSKLLKDVGIDFDDEDGELVLTLTTQNGQTTTKPTIPLPTLTSTKSGVVKANPKTSEDTQEVHVDSEGKLWTKPSSGSGGVDRLFYISSTVPEVISKDNATFENTITSGIYDQFKEKLKNEVVKFTINKQITADFILNFSEILCDLPVGTIKFFGCVSIAGIYVDSFKFYNILGNFSEIPLILILDINDATYQLNTAYIAQFEASENKITESTMKNLILYFTNPKLL